jgi:hypothetical protein
MDLVYILGNGSNWQDNEIRYSLRSLETFVSGIDKVYLIGKKPNFLNDNIIHIPFNDIHTNKAKNIMAKVYRASLDQRISQDFMFWNDDYFALQPFEAANYPFYYKCELDHSLIINKGEYYKHVETTLKVLKSKGLPIKNFDTHYPIIYNRDKMKQMIESYDWNVQFGYILRSMYCNHYGIEGEFKLDCKSNVPLPAPHIPIQHKDKHFLSIGDNALNFAMKNYLMNLYPNKSKFEL